MIGLSKLKFFLRQTNLRRVHRTHRLENLNDYSDVDIVVERYTVKLEVLLMIFRLTSCFHWFNY